MESLVPLKQSIAIRPELIAQSTTTIRVRQHTAKLSRGNFTISTMQADEEPVSNTILSVESDFGSWSQRRLFRDALGLPLFEMSRKRAGVTWYIRLPGEEPIATIVPKVNFLKDKFDVHFRNAAANGEDTMLEVRGLNVWKTTTNVYHDGKLVMIVKLTDIAAVYLPIKRPSWEVVMTAGIDLSLVRRPSFSF